MSSTKKGHSWIVLSTQEGGRLHCLRCGKIYRYEKPIEVWVLSAISKGFEQEHKGCKLKPEGLHCGFCNQTGHVAPDGCPMTRTHDPEAWLRGPDTGTSSITIWSVMMDRPSVIRARGGASIPWDPDDFGRCHRLMKLFPEWRTRLPEVALAYPEWAGLVANWAELEMLYETERPSGLAPRLYARMKEVRR
jgi:uncharacterized C2H2 Zn-finger protein